MCEIQHVYYDFYYDKIRLLNTLKQKELERQLEQENEELKAREEVTEYIENQQADQDHHDEENVMYQTYSNEPESVHANQS